MQGPFCLLCLLPGVGYNDCNSEIAGVSMDSNLICVFVDSDYMLIGFGIECRQVEKMKVEARQAAGW